MSLDIVCLDLEGVLVPEIWINVADRTGIPDLRLTTKDIADYNELMAHRLDILEREGIGLADIQNVIAELTPMDGANAFLDRLRGRFQVVILSDTFYEFAQPLMRLLDWPTLFCHRIHTDKRGRISGYTLRMPNHKKAAVDAFKRLNFSVLAAGDSYNDTAMLGAADTGILFRPPANVIREFPEFTVVTEYNALFDTFDRARAGD
jgi:phosphoserine/homoserine phosphotransferase